MRTNFCTLTLNFKTAFHISDVVFLMRFKFVFEFEFVLKYGNKRTVKIYMVIQQIKSWFIFVLKTTKKGKITKGHVKMCHRLHKFAMA